LFDEADQKSEDIDQEADPSKDKNEGVVVMRTMTTLAQVSEKDRENIVG